MHELPTIQYGSKDEPNVLCYVFAFCLRPVSCVPNVASVSGLPILDYPFGFLQHLFHITTQK